MATEDVPDIVDSWTEEQRNKYFYDHIDIDDETDCWIWTGSTQKVGDNRYGHIYLGKSEQVSAKMVAYHLEVEGGLPIKPKHETIIRRGCPNSLCVNPIHTGGVHHRRKKGTVKKTPKRIYEKQDWCESGLHNLNVPGARTADGSQCRRCIYIRRRKRARKETEAEREARLKQKREHYYKIRENWAERAVELLESL